MKRLARLFLGAVVSTGFISCSTDPQVSSKTGDGISAGGGSTSGGGGTLKLPSGSGDGSGASGGASSTGGAGSTDPEKTCGLETFMLERLPPELLLVLDRSSSMRREAKDSVGTLWSDTVGALDQVVRTTEASVQWGLKMFPYPSGCDVSQGVEVPIGAVNHRNVLNSVMMANYNMTSETGTPTRAAMLKAIDYLGTVRTKNPKYIVLATDGEPNCDGGITGAVQAVREAASAGFKTFVVGIAIERRAHDVLNQMALAGGEPRSDLMFRYYPVANKADLIDVLNQITVRVSNCVFPLSKAPPAPESVKVTVDGQRVPQDKNNGWSYGPKNMSIQLNGSWCEQVKAGKGQNVSIVFGCKGMIIP
jgi:hypothetical protein